MKACRGLSGVIAFGGQGPWRRPQTISVSQGGRGDDDRERGRV